MKATIETSATGGVTEEREHCANPGGGCSQKMPSSGVNGTHQHPAGGPSSYCSTEPGQWVRVVRDFVKLLKFGEVHLTVHKGRVIEVRKIEKVRFDEKSIQ